MIKKVILIVLTLLCVSIFSIPTLFADDAPVGQTSDAETEKKDQDEGITADVFGDKGGVFHPFLTTETIFSTNVYYTNIDEDSGFVTTVKPGIWIALPESREKLMNIRTTTTAPGGVEYSHVMADKSRRMQTYFLYSPSFIFYSDDSDYNHTDHTLEAMFNYNFGFNVSLEIFDQYNIKSNVNDDGLGKLFDEYYDNVFTIITAWEPSPKFKLRFDYSNYLTVFDKTVNEYRDRQDNSFSAYTFFKFWPSTSLFLEYERSNVDYDNRTDGDSFENRLYAGVDWEISAKSKGRIKAGYIEKEFDLNADIEEADLALEAQIQYTITPKSSVSLNSYRKYHETSMTDSDFVTTTGVGGAFLLRFSEKWSGAINASFTRETYEGSDQNGTATEREDDTFGIGPGLKFDAKKWLVFEGGYHYTTRSSTISTYEYDASLIYLRMKIEL